MKILQVCSASEIGGGEVHVAGLVRSLAGRGHALYLAVRPNSPLRDPLAGVITSWHELPLRNSLDVKSARGITEIVKEHKIDIVHAHLGRDYLVAALATRKSQRAKLILTRHHYLPIKQNALYRWLLHDVAAVIAVSRSVADSISERLALDPEKVHVIPNWIDPERFNPVDRDAARAMFRIKSPIAVACIGQLTPAKGQEEFIKAAGRIGRMRTDVEFIVAGAETGEEEKFTTHLQDLAVKLGISERVSFKGHVRHIPELLAAVDVVVVPSWDEGFSLVAIEAMASRRAVVASDIGGLKDIIKDNFSGVLFPSRDSNALANKLLWVVSDAPFRERIAAQGQKEVYARFNREHVIDRIEALYKKVLGENEKES
ncbi:MAG TPA: glycosyltransferase family 4 protein [Blastocatellia bacterium]|nr:glycosyltransferase family 4 protein [Blastocatellia bacterium]